jgi:hypothetical protein
MGRKPFTQEEIIEHLRMSELESRKGISLPDTAVLTEAFPKDQNGYSFSTNSVGTGANCKKNIPLRLSCFSAPK